MRLLLLASLLALGCGGSPADSGAPADDGSGGAAGAGDDGADDTAAGGAEGGDDGTDVGGGDGTDDGSTGDDTADTGTDFCDGKPVVTYANFGRSLMTESCQGCHASTATERYGAPESVTFDTVDQCWAWKGRILARSTGDAPSMPPSGGVTSDDRLLLEVWLTCADPGT